MSDNPFQSPDYKADYDEAFDFFSDFILKSELDQNAVFNALAVIVLMTCESEHDFYLLIQQFKEGWPELKRRREVGR
jgi:hypothetical protein